jgi:hypothetical protein
MHTPNLAQTALMATTTALLVAVLGLPSDAAAQTSISWTHAEGTPGAALAIGGQPLPVGSILATGFTPEHPVRIDKIRIAWWGKAFAKVELHIWRDNGGGQPGAPEGLYTDAPGADWIPPRTITTAAAGEWTEHDLSDAGLVVPAIEPVWIGVRITEAGANVAVDTIEENKADITALVQAPGTQCADGCGVPADLFIEVQGETVGELSARWFTEVSATAGAKPGGRMAWGDFDDDGDADLLVNGRQLYRNEGDGTFVDISATAGLQELAVHGGLWGDMDNDGHLDLFLYGKREAVARGLGDGTFEVLGDAVPREAANRDFPTEAAAWVDLDQDGLLDAYTASYETVQKDANGQDVLGVCDIDKVWHNQGDGTFVDVGLAWGFRGSDEDASGMCGRTVAPLDWDQDGDVDVFVGNYRLDPNFFFRNESPAAAVTDIATWNETIGTMVQGAYGHTIGAGWADADGDGDFDLFLANLAHPRFITFSDRSRLYQNLGEEQGWYFTEHREASGVTFQETNSSARWADFDNNGWPDLAITNVYKGRKGRLWRATGPQQPSGDAGAWVGFEDATYPSGVIVDNGWGSAWADYDGDGDLDYAARNVLYRNDYSTVAGDAGGWLQIRLRGGDRVNTAAIGAWLTLELPDGRTPAFHVSGGQGIGCQDDLVIHAGLGAATSVARVTIHWPGLEPDVREGPFEANQRLTFSEPGTTAPGGDDTAAGADAAGAQDTSAADGGGSADGSGAAQDDGAPGKTQGGGCSAAPTPRRRAPWAPAALGLLVALGGLITRRRQMS